MTYRSNYDDDYEPEPPKRSVHSWLYPPEYYDEPENLTDEDWKAIYEQMEERE